MNRSIGQGYIRSITGTVKRTHPVTRAMRVSEVVVTVDGEEAMVVVVGCEWRL